MDFSSLRFPSLDLVMRDAASSYLGSRPRGASVLRTRLSSRLSHPLHEEPAISGLKGCYGRLLPY